jgi:simple sugar transport system substrate-binding protein
MQHYVKILLAAAASLFFVCAPIDAQAADKMRVIFITHGQAGDPYWNAIKNGLAEAAKAYDADVTYERPTSSTCRPWGR